MRERQCEWVVDIFGDESCGRAPGHPCPVQQRYYESCDIRKLIDPNDPITKEFPCPDCGGTGKKLKLPAGKGSVCAEYDCPNPHCVKGRVEMTMVRVSKVKTEGNITKTYNPGGGVWCKSENIGPATITNYTYIPITPATMPDKFDGCEWRVM